MQYRITINGTVKMLSEYPKNWGEIAYNCDERGATAILESRSIFELDYLELVEHRDGHIILKDKVITPWQVRAQIN